MRKKHRRPKPFRLVWARLPDQYTRLHYYFDKYGQFEYTTMYPNDEVFDWLDAYVPDYSFQDWTDHAVIELKNEQQFIMARLTFGVTRKSPLINWRPRKRSHWRNASIRSL
jgi:hypothetical protein